MGKCKSFLAIFMIAFLSFLFLGKASVWAAPVIPAGVTADANGFYVKDGNLYSYVGNASEVVIPNGVKTIKSEAFSNLNNVTKIVMPDSLTTIEKSAIYNCKNLSELQFGKNVSSMASSSIGFCKNIKKITVPSLTKEQYNSQIDTIGYQVFYDYFDSRTKGFSDIELVIPKDATYVPYMFLKLDISKVTVENGNNTFYVKDSVLYKKEMLEDGSVQKVVSYVPNNLANVTLDPSVSVLGSLAFCGIYENSVTIPNTIKSFERDSLSYASFSTLVWDCDSDNASKNAAYNDKDFYIGVSKLVLTENSAKSSSNIFPSKMADVRTLQITRGVDMIDSSWYDILNLTSINVEENNSKYVSLNGCLYEYTGEIINGQKALKLIKVPAGGGISEFYVADNTVEIADNAICGTLTCRPYVVYESEKIKKIILPDSVNTIGSKLVGYQIGLTDISIGGNVKIIKSEAFNSYNNVSLTFRSDISDDLELKNKALSRISTINFPDSFDGNLEKFINPDISLNLKNIVINSTNPNFKVVDGVVYSKDGTKLLYYPEGKSEAEYIIPEGVKEISPFAFCFREKKNLKIVLPSTLNRISSKTFYAASESSIEIDAVKCPMVSFNSDFAKNITKIDSLYVDDSLAVYANDNNIMCEYANGIGTYTCDYQEKEDGHKASDNKVFVKVFDDAGNEVKGVICSDNSFIMPSDVKPNSKISVSFTSADSDYDTVFVAVTVDTKSSVTIPKFVFPLKKRVSVVPQSGDAFYVNVYDKDGKFVTAMDADATWGYTTVLEKGEYTLICHKCTNGKMDVENITELTEKYQYKDGVDYASVSIKMENQPIVIDNLTVPDFTDPVYYFYEADFSFTEITTAGDMGYHQYEIRCKRTEEKLNDEFYQIIVKIPETLHFVEESVTYADDSADNYLPYQIIPSDNPKMDKSILTEGSYICFDRPADLKEDVIRFSCIENTDDYEKITGTLEAYYGSYEYVSGYGYAIDFGKDTFIGQLEVGKPFVSVYTKSHFSSDYLVVNGRTKGETEVDVYVKVEDEEIYLDTVYSNIAGVWIYEDYPLHNEGAKMEYYARIKDPCSDEYIESNHVTATYSRNFPEVDYVSFNNPYGEFELNMDTLYAGVVSYYPVRVSTFEIGIHKDENIKKLYLTGRGFDKELIKKNGNWFFQGADVYFPDKIKIEALIGNERITILEFSVHWIIDPSGIAYETFEDNPVEGATARIYYRNEYYEKSEWEAEPYGQINPQITNSSGAFAWDVPMGEWKIKVSKSGYETAESKWLNVPPVQTDVNLELISKEGPKVTSVELSQNSMRVSFDKYVYADTKKFDYITLSGEKTFKITGAKPVDPRKYYKKDVSRQFIFEFEDNLSENEPEDGYTLRISETNGYGGILSYASVSVKNTEIAGLHVDGIIENVSASTQWIVTEGDMALYKVKATPCDAAKGRQLSAVVGDDSSAVVVSASKINKDGEGIIVVKGIKAGETNVFIGIEDSAAKTEANVIVSLNDTIKQKLGTELDAVAGDNVTEDSIPEWPVEEPVPVEPPTEPTKAPEDEPSAEPTKAPEVDPSKEPETYPVVDPTQAPLIKPSKEPSDNPAPSDLQESSKETTPNPLPTPAIDVEKEISHSKEPKENNVIDSKSFTIKTYVGDKSAKIAIPKNAGKLTFTTSDKKIATLNKNGKLSVKKAGSCTVTVKATKNGVDNLKYTINVFAGPKKAVFGKCKVTDKGKKIEMCWKKDSAATGYEIVYSSDKKFTKRNTKTVDIKKASIVTKKIVKKNAKTYIKIRSYKSFKINGKKVKVYGPYSSVKSVK